MLFVAGGVSRFRFMVVLPLVVRGIGPGGYTGLLTDEDVDLVFNDLAAYRLVG